MDDREILDKFKNEQSRNLAFNQLIRKYQERIYWHIRKMVIDHDDANDITQDTFIKAFKGLSAFREESQLFTWLYRIATNECLNFLNKKKRKLLFSLDNLENQLLNKLESSTNLDGDFIQMKLQKALLTLPEKQRLVFNMKYFDEMKYEDISSVLNTSVGALKASYHHAVKKIELSLNED